MFASKHAVPALTCNISWSASDTINDTWSYIHTGGLPLTMLSVSYTSMEDTFISNPTEIQVKTFSDTSVVASGLMAGKLYTFNVTAANDIHLDPWVFYVDLFITQLVSL